MVQSISVCFYDNIKGFETKDSWIFDKFRVCSKAICLENSTYQNRPKLTSIDKNIAKLRFLRIFKGVKNCKNCKKLTKLTKIDKVRLPVK